jgi:hypothetical protein
VEYGYSKVRKKWGEKQEGLAAQDIILRYIFWKGMMMVASAPPSGALTTSNENFEP